MKASDIGWGGACFFMLMSAQAADFRDDSVGVRYGWSFSNPGTNRSDIDRTIVNVTHYNTDALGSNFFLIDGFKSSGNEPSANGHGGAQEFYSIYARHWSYRKLFDVEQPWGIVRDLNLTTRVDYGHKDDDFAALTRKLTVGPMLSFDVPGYLEVGVYAVKELSYNGIVDKQVNYNVAAKLGAVWMTPLGNGFKVKGFIDVIGPKGKDGFGLQTKTETLLQVKLLADAGSLFQHRANGLEFGAGIEYWHNKFGDDPALMKAGTTRQLAPMLVVDYHF